MVGDHPWDGGSPSQGWWLTMTIYGSFHLVLILWIKSMCPIPLVEVYVPNYTGRLWMVGDQPWDGGWPSWGWWVTINGSCHLVLILWAKFRCQNRLIPIVSKPILVVVARTYVSCTNTPWQFASVKKDPRNLPLKFGHNWVSNSWDIPDIDICC